MISEDTTLQQLQNLAEKLEERFGVHAFQIYTHKDEGANVWDGREEAWKPNYHAHMIFDWTDGHTGKTVKLNKHDMAEMQTITAECLNMERGVSSDRKHLSAMQYKNQMETEKAGQLQKDIEQLSREYSTGTQKVNQVLDELDTARKELKSMKTDIHINEAKEAAAKAGKTVFNAVTSVFNVGEVKSKPRRLKPSKRKLRPIIQKPKSGRTAKNQHHCDAKGTGNSRQTNKSTSSQTQTYNGTVSGNGKRRGKHRRTPEHGSTKQRYPATPYRQGNTLHRKPLRQGQEKIIPG